MPSEAGGMSKDGVIDPIPTWPLCLGGACKSDFISLSLSFPESQEGEETL